MQRDAKNEDFIVGRNAVAEALRAGREIDTLYVLAGERVPAVRRLVSAARESGAVVKEVDRKKLDALSGGAVHQGVAALAAAHSYASLDDIFALARQRGEPPFVVVCDELEDPHNLGAVLRTAEAAGAHGVVVPKRRSAPLSATVAKTSAGALEYIPVARVPNLPAALDTLKANGCWVYGADMDGTDYKQTDFSGGVALVVGAEGKGLGRLVREKCDAIVSLPMKGKINSLNASVAAGILLYEISAHRTSEG
ncbi:MAG TPA: 23S rRNA (guanosine(2251)-2'-O)-methyltransferase RlmB [Candidatus Fimenecus excrementigallinarum]|uniref:23S rRNA (Guanosine(2251)-2'-O)-methyltransferase RlmB n=1 Tax=Candidatus Fimenecus excrementigallinarum TaxID=2840816 RepID=A0A9D1IFS9_9FIRM|nr:23S rRNA (guanosine(2251)-2'-O)-methyltransferase RlmB [Candidatus Fimenecus excrementigallinarum]